MNFGLFLMPSHPPERNRYDAAQWDLDVIQWADQLGFSEVWIGEHFSSPWEPVPSPDLIIAQALQRTERIKLAPGLICCHTIIQSNWPTVLPTLTIWRKEDLC